MKTLSSAVHPGSSWDGAGNPANAAGAETSRAAKKSVGGRNRIMGRMTASIVPDTGPVSRNQGMGSPRRTPLPPASNLARGPGCAQFAPFPIPLIMNRFADLPVAEFLGLDAVFPEA